MEVLQLFQAGQSWSLTEEMIMIALYWKIEHISLWTEMDCPSGLCFCSWIIGIFRLNTFSIFTRLSRGLIE